MFMREVKAFTHESLFETHDVNDFGIVCFSRFNLGRIVSNAAMFAHENRLGKPFIATDICPLPSINALVVAAQSCLARWLALITAIKTVAGNMNIFPAIVKTVMVFMVNFYFWIGQAKNKAVHKDVFTAGRSSVPILFTFAAFCAVPIQMANEFVIGVIDQCFKSVDQWYRFHIQCPLPALYCGRRLCRTSYKI